MLISVHIDMTTSGDSLPDLIKIGLHHHGNTLYFITTHCHTHRSTSLNWRITNLDHLSLVSGPTWPQNQPVSYHCSSSDSLSNSLINVSSSLNFKQWSLVVHNHKNHPVIHHYSLSHSSTNSHHLTNHRHLSTRRLVTLSKEWYNGEEKKRKEKKTLHKKTNSAKDKWKKREKKIHS